MQIVIAVEETNPPTGQVVVSGEGIDAGDAAGCSAAIPFTGWLGLLSVVTDLIEAGVDDNGR